MHDDQPTTTQQVTGQMRSLFYLVDEPNTTLSLLVNGQAIITRAAGQIALDLRAAVRRDDLRDVVRCAALRSAYHRCHPQPLLIEHEVITGQIKRYNQQLAAAHRLCAK